MEKINFGDRVKSLSIPRCQVASNTRGCAIVIDFCPRVKQVAYDPELKCRVEVSQDDCINYHLNARINYMLLIGRLNTDMKGRVCDSSIQLEYLSMADSVYNAFVDNAANFGNFEVIQLVRKERSVNDKYGYVEPQCTRAHTEIPQEVFDQVNLLREDTEKLEAIWAMIDQDTSITMDQYLKRLEEKQNEGGASPALPPQQHQRPAVGSQQAAQKKIGAKPPVSKQSAAKPTTKPAQAPSPQASAQPAAQQPSNGSVADPTDEPGGGEDFGDNDFGDFNNDDFGGSDFN